MDIQISDIVIPLNGRDEGKSFFVVNVEDQYAFIADGRGRRLEKPKRKKHKHLKVVASDDSRTSLKLRSGERISNSEIRWVLTEQHAAAHEEKGGM